MTTASEVMRLRYAHFLRRVENLCRHALPRPMTVPWRTLSTDEILIHLSLKTPVAAWLKRRMELRMNGRDFMDLVL